MREHSISLVVIIDKFFFFPGNDNDIILMRELYLGGQAASRIQFYNDNPNMKKSFPIIKGYY